MSALVFLLAFVALSLLGGFLLWLRERSPRSMEAHIRDFERQREALSPGYPPKHRRATPPSRVKGRRAG